MKIKILAALIVAVAGFSFFNYSDASAKGKSVSSQAECEALGSGITWAGIPGIGNRCIASGSDKKEACEEAGGAWTTAGRSYCEIKVDDDGKLLTTIKRPTDTFKNQDCNILPDHICDAKDEQDFGESAVWQIVLTLINILTGGVAVLALAGIVYGSVLYSSAGGNPEQVKKAKNTIMNVVIGIIAFGLMYSLLQWIVPGGVFN